jgi:uncharacterized integral membrane protein
MVPEGDETTDVTPGRSRTSTLLTGLVVGAVALVLLLVFVLQNDQQEDYELLWWDVTLRSGAALLLAAAFGAVAVGLVAAARVLQLRRAARRHRNLHHI